MTTGKALIASPGASSIRGELEKMIRFRDPHVGFWMTGTLKFERRTDVPVSPQYLQNFRPHAGRARRLNIADDVHSVLGTREENIDAVWKSEESRIPLIIAAY
jgi:hypothetical protein